jgi:hypothetical protein
MLKSRLPMLLLHFVPLKTSLLDAISEDVL